MLVLRRFVVFAVRLHDAHRWALCPLLAPRLRCLAPVRALVGEWMSFQQVPGVAQATPWFPGTGNRPVMPMDPLAGTHSAAVQSASVREQNAMSDPRRTGDPERFSGACMCVGLPHESLAVASRRGHTADATPSGQAISHSRLRVRLPRGQDRTYTRLRHRPPHRQGQSLPDYHLTNSHSRRTTRYTTHSAWCEPQVVRGVWPLLRLWPCPVSYTHLTLPTNREV